MKYRPTWCENHMPFSSSYIQAALTLTESSTHIESRTADVMTQRDAIQISFAKQTPEVWKASFPAITCFIPCFILSRPGKLENYTAKDTLGTEISLGYFFGPLEVNRPTKKKMHFPLAPFPHTLPTAISTHATALFNCV